MHNIIKTRSSCLRAFLQPSLSSHSHQYQTQNDQDDQNEDDALDADADVDAGYPFEQHQAHQRYNNGAMKRSANESFQTGITGRSDSTIGSRTPSSAALGTTTGTHGPSSRFSSNSTTTTTTDTTPTDRHCRSKPRSKRNMKQLNAICNLIPSSSSTKGVDAWKSHSYTNYSPSSSSNVEEHINANANANTKASPSCTHNIIIRHRHRHRHNRNTSKDTSSTFSTMEFDNVSFSHSTRSQVGLLGSTDEQYLFPVEDDSEHDFCDDAATETYNDPLPQVADTESLAQDSHIIAGKRSTSLSSALKGCVPHRKKITQFRSRSRSSLKSSMPHIPEGTQPQSQSHIPTYDFPQIVFANEGNSQEDASELDRDGSQSQSIPDIQPFSAYERHSQYGPQHGQHGHGSHRNNSHHNNAQSHGQEEPIDPQMMQNQSPIQSKKEYRHEEQFLDTLANLTLHDNYQNLQQHIYELTGKNETQRMTEHQQHLQQYQNHPYLYANANTNVNAIEAGVPDVVGQGTLDDQSDLVSEFGMGSTSGGRYNDGPIMMHSLAGNEAQKNDCDYGPSRVNRAPAATAAATARKNTGTDRLGSHANYAIRGRQESMREQGVGVGARPQGAQRTAVHQWLHSGQQDISNGNVDGAEFEFQLDRPLHEQQKYSSSRQNHIDGAHVENNDPTYAFGGPSARSTPLAPSGGFDEFGIDDRVYTGKYESTNILELDSSEDNPDSQGYNHAHHKNSQPFSSNVRPVRSASPPPSRNTHESIERMPSPKRVGLQSRPKKEDAFEKWKEERRAASLQKNMQRQILLDESEGGSVASSRRSNKYREVLGAPYKITKGDRHFSTESSQTRKWSNKSNIRENRLPNLMRTHDEEKSSASSRLAGHSKGPDRKSPHSVAQYNDNEW